MSRDFTLEKYKELLKCFQSAGYQFYTFEEYCEGMDSGRFVILRHDVDKKPSNSLATAHIEQKLGIKSSYYFRAVGQSNNPETIKAIVAMGHEIGYHYEDMSLFDGDVEKALAHFGKQLAYFRQYYPVKTICMHGAPHSQYDGRDLWRHVDYHGFGVIGEPYFDVDFSQVFYLTDTGRRWDGFNVSLRDKVPVFQDEWIHRGLVYHTTDEVMAAIDKKNLPERLMMTTHPQRWSDGKFEWVMEKCKQSVKNLVKRRIVYHR